MDVLLSRNFKLQVSGSSYLLINECIVIGICGYLGVCNFL